MPELIERGYIFVKGYGMPRVAFTVDVFSDGVGGFAFPPDEVSEEQQEGICQAMQMLGYTVGRELSPVGEVVTAIPREWSRELLLNDFVHAFSAYLVLGGSNGH